MSTLSATTLAQRSAHKTSEFGRGLIFVAMLYLAVAIVELSIIVRAAPSIAEIGSFYVTVP